MVKNNKISWIVIAMLIALGAVLILVIRIPEDDWIRDEKGVWIKHGNPSSVPDYVLEQQDAIRCVQEKLDAFKDKPNSQCLDTCSNYSVDFVHVPRTAEDDLMENQCAEYRNRFTEHFIELNNKNGEIVRIV